MTALLDCPGMPDLQALLGDTLSPEQREAFERHLESCASCQERIDANLENQDCLKNLGRLFGDPTTAPMDPVLDRVRERLHEVKSPVRSAPTDTADLSFLRISNRPGVMGMLGEYEVQEVIGQGGMGIVLKASEPALHRVVAVKVMAPFLASSATARRRFTREARAAAAVCHDHVVTVHGVHEENGLPYLVMQYVAGESLQARLDRTGPLEVVEVVRIGLQTAQGLAAAHAQGLIHRDIKPANLLLENGLARVKITDFGLARMSDDVQLTRDGVVAGTPEYMAPEQARGEVVDHRADLFSLGSVLYAACTGLPPFRGSTALAVLQQVSEQTPVPVRAANPDVPEWLETLVNRLMAKNRVDRFQTAGEVATLLEGYLAHLCQPLSVAAPQLVPLPPARRAGAGNWLPSRSSFLAASVLVAVLGFAWLGLLPILRSRVHAQPQGFKPPSGNVDVWSVAVSRQAGIVAAGAGLWDQPGEIGVWNLSNKEPWAQPVQRFADELGVASVAISPDGKRLASGSWSGHVRVFDWAAGTQLFDFPVGDVARVAFSPDGRLLAAVTENKTAQIWDVATGKLWANLEGDLFRFHCVAFSPDGKHLLAGGGDWNADGVNQVTIWDVESKTQVNKLVGHVNAVLSICFSPDGKTIATGAADSRVLLWDAASGKQVKTLSGHGHWVEGLAFTSDSKTLVSGSTDGTVRFWDIEKGIHPRVIATQGKVRTVCFTPDEDILIVGGGSKTLKFYDVKNLKQLTAPWSGSDKHVVPMDLFPIATQMTPERKGWLVALGLVGLGTACLLSLSFAVMRSIRHRRAEHSPAEEAAVATSVSFPCSQCGKTLKGKADLAGKRVKCPNCGKPTRVPGQQTIQAKVAPGRCWWKRLDVLVASAAAATFGVALVAGVWLSRPPKVPYVSRLQILADRVRAQRTDIIDARPFSGVTDRDLEVIRELPYLRDLNLDHTETTDEGLKEIATIPSLVNLSLTNTQVTDNGLALLSSLTNIEFLRLDRLPITDAGLAHLRALPRLKKLSLFKTGVTDSGMTYLKEVPALEEVSLDETQVSDEGLRHLCESKSIKVIKVWNTRVTPAGIEEVKKAHPTMRVRR
jgi:serine/threonine protein kinase